MPPSVAVWIDFILTLRWTSSMQLSLVNFWLTGIGHWFRLNLQLSLVGISVAQYFLDRNVYRFWHTEGDFNGFLGPIGHPSDTTHPGCLAQRVLGYCSPINCLLKQKRLLTILKQVHNNFSFGKLSWCAHECNSSGQNHWKRFGCWITSILWHLWDPVKEVPTGH